MTQDEKWMAHYEEVLAFIQAHHRNPSKYNPDERLMVHFLKHNRKLLNSSSLKESRAILFKQLLFLCEANRRVNQWG